MPPDAQSLRRSVRWYRLVTAARTPQAVDMFVPLIAISLLGLILNGLRQAARSYLLRGFPQA